MLGWPWSVINEWVVIIKGALLFSAYGITSPTLTVIPTVTPTPTLSSSGEQNLAFIAAPVVVIAVIIITLTAIVLAVLIYRHGSDSNRGGSFIYVDVTMHELYTPCTCGFESHLRQLIFSRKSDCLGCAVLLCLVCLFDLACFFLSSFSSLI